MARGRCAAEGGHNAAVTLALRGWRTRDLAAARPFFARALATLGGEALASGDRGNADSVLEFTPTAIRSPSFIFFPCFRLLFPRSVVFLIAEFFCQNGASVICWPVQF